MKNIFTTATATGVAVRYWTTLITAVIAAIGALGFLTEDQQRVITEAIPGLMTALAVIVSIGMTIYAAINKSSSDKAAEAAKVVDTLPKSLPVTVKAEGHEPVKIQPTK